MTFQHTVLIVDDDADTRDMLSDHLSSSGFAVAQAKSGMEALELMASLKPHVVLMDLAMPHMNGAEVVRRIKSNPATRHTTVFVVTGYVYPRNVNVAHAAGADAVFLKPLDLDELSAAIHKTLAHLTLAASSPGRNRGDLPLL